MRRALTALALVTVLAVLADAVGTRSIEQSAARRAQEALEAPVDVDLSGWPVTVRALAGSVPRASLTATDVPVGDTRAVLSRVEATLTDVDVRSAGELVAAGHLPPAAGGRWSAELDEGDLRAVMSGIGEPRLGDGVVRVTVAGVVIEATVTAEGGRLVVVPTAPLLDWARVEVGFEDLPGAPSVERVDVGPSAVRIEGRLHPPPRDPVATVSP